MYVEIMGSKWWQTTYPIEQQLLTNPTEVSLLNGSLVNGFLLDESLVNYSLVDKPLVDSPFVNRSFVDSYLIKSSFINNSLVDKSLVNNSYLVNIDGAHVDNNTPLVTISSFESWPSTYLISSSSKFFIFDWMQINKGSNLLYWDLAFAHEHSKHLLSKIATTVYSAINE